MKQVKTYRPQDLTFSSLMANAPADLCEYINTLKNIDQRRDRHPEGDVFTHTLTVVNRVAKYGDIELSIAALLHDEGKTRTTMINEKTGQPKSPGHEKYSAECVWIWSDWIRSMGADTYIVYSLILNHMVGKLKSTTTKHMNHLKAQHWYDKLEKLMDADHGGTDIL